MPKNPRPSLRHPSLDDVSLVTVLHALADPTRLTIVRTLLNAGEGRPCGTFPVDIAPSTLSHHFRVLREAGIIHQSQRGTRRWTSLRSAEFDERFPGLLQAIMAQEPRSAGGHL